jgi:hypothetical protein
MSTPNPYQPPTTNDYADGRAANDGGQIPSEAIDALRETKPWVGFMAILGFVGAGFLVIAGLVMVAFGSSLGRKESAPLGLMYLLVSLIYIAPSLFLRRYSHSIGRLLERGDTHDFIDAMRNQKSFWRTVGILSLVFLGVMVLMVVIGAVAGVALMKR